MTPRNDGRSRDTPQEVTSLHGTIPVRWLRSRSERLCAFAVNEPERRQSGRAVVGCATMCGGLVVVQRASQRSRAIGFGGCSVRSGGALGGMFRPEPGVLPGAQPINQHTEGDESDNNKKSIRVVHFALRFFYGGTAPKKQFGRDPAPRNLATDG